MKAKTLSIFNYLLSCILSMFGFQSCREEEMYGCPHADYKVDVCVINDKGEGMPYEKVVIRKCDEKERHIPTNVQTQSILVPQVSVFINSIAHSQWRKSELSQSTNRAGMRTTQCI